MFFIEFSNISKLLFLNMSSNTIPSSSPLIAYFPIEAFILLNSVVVADFEQLIDNKLSETLILQIQN